MNEKALGAVVSVVGMEGILEVVVGIACYRSEELDRVLVVESWNRDWLMVEEEVVVSGGRW